MKRLAGCLAVAAVAASGCGSDDDPSTPTDSVGLANPASVFCVEQGGTYALGQADGSGGTCTLPDGRVVDAWEFFRANAPTAG